MIFLVWLSGSKSFAQSQFNSGVIDFDTLVVHYGSYGPGPGAIGSAGDLWNSVGIGSSSASDLYATTGVTTSVGFSGTYLGGGGSYPPNGTLGDLFQLFSMWSSLSITGLKPSTDYELFLIGNYSHTNEVSVNGVTFLTPIVQLPVSSMVDGIDYDMQIVMANSSGDLVFTGLINPDFYISSWQLTPAPEPECWALVSVGLLTTFCNYLWRRRRD